MMSFNRRAALIGAAVLLTQPAFAQAQKLRIGVTPGPHALIMEAVKPVAAGALYTPPVARLTASALT